MKHLPLLLLLVLSACAGYTPLYAPASGSGNLAAQIEVGPVQMEYIAEENVGERRVAQTVSQRLRQDFPNAGADMDVLKVSIREETSALALRRTKLIEREQVSLIGRVTLTSPDGKQLFTTDVASSTAYNVETTPFSTESGKSFARLTAADNLAEEVVRRLALYYRQNPPSRIAQ